MDLTKKVTIDNFGEVIEKISENNAGNERPPANKESLKNTNFVPLADLLNQEQNVQNETVIVNNDEVLTNESHPDILPEVNQNKTEEFQSKINKTDNTTTNENKNVEVRVSPTFGGLKNSISLNDQVNNATEIRKDTEELRIPNPFEYPSQN